AVTEVASASTESATHGAVYPDFEGWILHQVSGDYRDWLHLGGRQPRFTVVESEIAPGRPKCDCTGRTISDQTGCTRIAPTLKAGRTELSRATFRCITRFAGWTCWTLGAAGIGSSRIISGTEKIRTIVADMVRMGNGAGRGKHRDSRQKQRAARFVADVDGKWFG